MQRHYKKRFLALLTLIILGVLAVWFLVISVPIKPAKILGVTFVPEVAENFGLDPQKVYMAIFDNLGVRNVRIAAYWDKIESKRSQYHFDELDWEVREAEKRGVKLILVVGKKVPRWPECHIPSWANLLSEEDQNQALLNYVTQVINRYKNSSAIDMWQVENEPFLPFGECVYSPGSVIDREIALVRSLDSSRKILVTDSGEISTWLRAARRGDIFGTTMYRRVVNKYFGYIDYHLPPFFFRLKRALVELVVGKKPMMVVELQGEPWLNKPVELATIEEQYRSMDPAYFNNTLEYASRTGFDTFYLWGVEWWYWLKEQGRPEIWDTMKEKIGNLNHEN